MTEPTGSGRFDSDNDPVFVQLCPACFKPLDTDKNCPHCNPPPEHP